jgi:hypothetical protein
MNPNTISLPWYAMPKKKENQNKSLQSECLVFALKNVDLNKIFIFIFYYLMSINYMRVFIRKKHQ